MAAAPTEVEPGSVVAGYGPAMNDSIVHFDAGWIAIDHNATNDAFEQLEDWLCVIAGADMNRAGQASADPFEQSA